MSDVTPEGAFHQLLQGARLAEHDTDWHAIAEGDHELLAEWLADAKRVTAAATFIQWQIAAAYAKPNQPKDTR